MVTMTGLNHVLTGAAVGLAIQQPLLVIPLAIASHFILDMIPHFDHEAYRYGSKYFARIMLSDALLCVGAVSALILLFPGSTLVIILGALGGILPDFFWLYYYQNGRPKHWFYRFHSAIQWFERPPGAMVELAYLVFISTVLVALTNKA